MQMNNIYACFTFTLAMGRLMAARHRLAGILSFQVW